MSDRPIQRLQAARVNQHVVHMVMWMVASSDKLPKPIARLTVQRMEIWQREGRKGRRGADGSILHALHAWSTNPLGPRWSSGLKLCGVPLIHPEGTRGELIQKS